ncbi:HAD hydrolase-like protein [Acrocarpospora catenulata]|uniref:HAD hydrolase-like protein n=1 Tax=Acrocarpospora catenulata TaxID=2836182 RepID=UPI001BDA0C8D|nr:HAD hydrolase-like protein [Acrocarpospora catenulata]
MTGRALAQPWQFDGRTELAAATDALRAHGLEPSAELVDAFIEMLLMELRERAGEMAVGGHVLAGADAALTALGAVAGVRQSVLTGNVHPLAVLKMELFGLDHHLDFRLGAYGGDAYERADLPAHAFERTERHLGYRHGGADTVIVGDTLRDVATAQAAGARVVPVATGTTSTAKLRAAGADVVLPDLADTRAVIQAITGTL